MFYVSFLMLLNNVCYFVAIIHIISDSDSVAVEQAVGILTTNDKEYHHISGYVLKLSCYTSCPTNKFHNSGVLSAKHNILEYIFGIEYEIDMSK